MCASCHYQLDRQSFREREFEIVLADLMRASSRFSGVRLNPEPSGSVGLRPDILAQNTDDGTTILIECKGLQTITAGRLRDALAQLEVYKKAFDTHQIVLALPARLTPRQKEIISSEGVQPWGLDEIASKFRTELEGVTHPVLRPLLLAAGALVAPGTAQSPERALLSELQALPPGRVNWVGYQKLVGRILERLFCPPLSTPILELGDEAGLNRRDIILPNYADLGFWAFVRDRYAADYLVVDAKNYAETVGKAEALQMLNYLKAHGAGLLGMIVCRNGADAGCLATIREHWAQHGKLVVILTDQHVEQMLSAKETGGPAEDVVRQWIEDFRLSL